MVVASEDDADTEWWETLVGGVKAAAPARLLGMLFSYLVEGLLQSLILHSVCL